MAVSAVETIGPEDATDHVGENGTVRGVGIGRYPNPQDLVLWGLGAWPVRIVDDVSAPVRPAMRLGEGEQLLRDFGSHDRRAAGDRVLTVWNSGPEWVAQHRK